MMDHIEMAPVDIREKNVASAERIKEKTMKKIHKSSSQPYAVRKISKLGVAVAVMAAILSITAFATAVTKWGGFAFVDGMTEAEKKAFIKDSSLLHTSVYEEDRNGYVHYLDEDGEEILVLSPKEAAKYEREREAAKVQAVQESTTLVDVSTMPYTPNVITELSVDEDGRFAECALGNSSMILLYPEDKAGYELKSGDVVTVELTANDICILEFGQFRDGAFVNTETATAQEHSHTFVIEEDGLYCFFVEYLSAGVSVFTDCSVMVEQDR